MQDRKKYYVQYRDSAGIWNNVDAGSNDLRQARQTLMQEATEDPEYNHRLVAIVEEVIGFIDSIVEG